MVLGEQRITAATLASATPLTIPAGANQAECWADTANVRFTRDGSTVPTGSVGGLIIAGAHQPTVFKGNLADLQFIAASGSPNLYIIYYGSAANA